MNMSISEKERKALEERLKEVTKNIFDPEIPVNIYDLGLIYNIEVDKDGNAKITMTLTSPNCPVAESLPMEVKEKSEGVQQVKSAHVSVTFEPPWDKSKISDEAKLELGLL